ncbi:MAG TPA: hypothetical protein VMY35_13405 [Phycisphaerae bacterium]|nr:hypothetical protein [Phycisphaerae bacterium]
MARLYVYAEQCVRAGEIATDDPEEAAALHDVFEWGHGSEEELLAQAVERLVVRQDSRPGGSGDAFAWRCARNVLDWLGTDPAEAVNDRIAGHDYDPVLAAVVGSALAGYYPLVAPNAVGDGWHFAGVIAADAELDWTISRIEHGVCVPDPLDGTVGIMVSDLRETQHRDA